LTAALRAAPEPASPHPGTVCPDIFTFPTTLVVIDRTGDATAPDLPTDAVCGHLTSQLTTAINAVKWKTIRTRGMSSTAGN
jgi:hypothetical protein